jgi:hypothetical protein
MLKKSSKRKKFRKPLWRNAKRQEGYDRGHPSQAAWREGLWRTQQDIGAWDAEDKGTDEGDGKVDKGSPDAGKGKSVENAILISDTEDEE